MTLKSYYPHNTSYNFNPQLLILISCGTSKKVLGTILEEQHDKEEWLLLHRVQSQVHKAVEWEALTTQFACERFHQYIYGKLVQIQTYYKSLATKFQKALNDYLP